MPKYDELKIRRHLRDGLVKAAAQEITVDDACKIAQSLALLSIADDLGTIKIYTGSILDQLERMRVDLDSIEQEFEK